MAHIRADRVLETSTTTGTGSLTLAGAEAGYQSFASVMSNGDTCFYAIEADDGSWETGLGTLSSGALARTTVLDSSTGSKLSLAAGTKKVMITAPAAEMQVMDQATYDALDPPSPGVFYFILEE